MYLEVQLLKWVWIPIFVVGYSYDGVGEGESIHCT